MCDWDKQVLSISVCTSLGDERSSKITAWMGIAAAALDLADC